MFSVNSNGVITVDTSDIKETFENAFKEALGDNLDLDVSTPQGQLIQTHTQIVNNIQTDLTTLANSFNIYTASGEALDNDGAFYGYYRKANQPTVVLGEIQGTYGTNIPAGSLVSNGEHNFELLDDVVIPVSGSIVAEFQCVDNGPIVCKAGTLTTIVSVITGWDDINNATDGIVGYNTETDNEFRNRITANWLNIRAKSLLGAIVDRIAQLKGVVSVIGRENVSSNTQTIDGLTLKPHSIWLTILGGKANDIAKILTEAKTIGANTNGNTQINYYDSNVNYTYLYYIERPAQTGVYFQVNYKSNAYTGATVQDDVENLINQYIADNPFKCGQIITGSDISKAFKNYSQIDLLSVKISTDNNTWQDYLAIDLDKVANIEGITANEVI